jgi:mRNA deadenylase 3'-5' endonuclease subunit Ccr4
VRRLLGWFQGAYKACLDYILVDKKQFEVVCSAPMPDVAVLSEFTALPSCVFGSDHVSIAADVRFRRGC